MFAAGIGREFQLHAYERALIGTIAFLGMLLGNLACLMNDYFGRRRPIQMSVLGMLLFSAASTLAATFHLLLALWFLTGFAYGIGVPTLNALISETTPTKLRLPVNNVALAVFAIGGIEAALL